MRLKKFQQLKPQGTDKKIPHFLMRLLEVSLFNSIRYYTFFSLLLKKSANLSNDVF